MILFEQEILTWIERTRSELQKPVVVALDGGSGAGKSTIADRLMLLTDVALVRLDNFYQTAIPESEWPRQSVEQRLSLVFDWSRVRSDAVDPLRAGRPGRYRAFDFESGLGETGTYSLTERMTEIAPASTILIDGAYSASPPLRDLIDIAILVDVPRKLRHSRLSARGEDDAFMAGWHRIWDDVETLYFERVCPPDSFDLIVRNEKPIEE